MLSMPKVSAFLDRRFMVAFLLSIIIDQLVKQAILGGFRWDSSCISITFVLNDGVAFSMFAFLKEYLKYFQILLIGGMIVYLYREGYFSQYPIEMGLVFGSGLSNLSDRFVHGGVVDFVYWHCGFNFAIFNTADVLIDAGMALLIFKLLVANKKQKAS